MNEKKVLFLPKYFSQKQLFAFLEDCEGVFKLIGKGVANFELNLRRIKKITPLGLLLTYKFMSFSMKHKCFNNPILAWNEEIKKEFVKYGFFNLLNSVVKFSENEIENYNALKPILNDKDSYFIPHVMIRNDVGKRSQLENDFFTWLDNNYKNQTAKEVAAIISAELISNFWSHATEESETVMLAYGNNEGVLKIVFVDNAQGIVSSLKPFFKGESDMEILRQSCRRGVTSKNNSYHLGRGLYQVSNLAKNNNGSVSFFSEGAYYCLSSKKERMKKCGYWKGTIVIVDVNLSNPKALDSIPAFEINQKVRWV